jgi:hypothetical protein
MRIPKLRGFKNRFKIEYEIVNVGAIGALAERGAFEVDASGPKGAKAAPITINQDILRAVGLVRTLNKPLKILGAGELSTALFVVADAFTGSARSKIEAAGGSVNVLEVPASPLAALGVAHDDDAGEGKVPPAAPSDSKTRSKAAKADATPAPAAEADVAPAPKPTPSAKAAKAPKASPPTSAKAPKARAAAAAEPVESEPEPAAPPPAPQALDPVAAEASVALESDESVEGETPAGGNA